MTYDTTNDGSVDCYDVVIAGGGPSGSTTAARLAIYGYRVLLLEEKLFPRFHIGESLLIGNQGLQPAKGDENRAGWRELRQRGAARSAGQWRRESGACVIERITGRRCPPPERR